MAFFKKLRNRLFKSSSKLDEGLEAIVEDGGETTATPDAASTDAPLETPPDAPPEVPAETQAETPLETQAETPVKTSSLAASDAHAAPAIKDAPEAERNTAPDPIPDPVPQPVSDPLPGTEPEPPATAFDPDPPAERDTDPAPGAAVMPAPEFEPEPEPEPPTEADHEDKPVEPAIPDPHPEASAPVEPEPQTPAPDEPEAVAPVPAKSGGLLSRLFQRRDTAAPVLRRTLDDDMLEQLEELLITADMGVDTALRVTANMAEGRMGRKLSVREIKELLASEVARIMTPIAKPLPLYPQKPQVVLVVGVNGSGKTTTIGKLASQFRAAGKQVVIAAGDTFRAAAVEQLQVWGTRAGVPVLTAPEGTDPASLAFDAMAQAQRDGADLLMIDTAGRLQNRGDLMEELAKIVRVIRKQDPDAPHNTLLVLDATTGQNALAQVKIFQEVADVTGLVMTKLDGTAKGGVLVALADQFGLPIHAIGVGEQIDDLAPFDPEEFAAALTGLDAE